MKDEKHGWKKSRVRSPPQEKQRGPFIFRAGSLSLHFPAPFPSFFIIDELAFLIQSAERVCVCVCVCNVDSPTLPTKLPACLLVTKEKLMMTAINAIVKQPLAHLCKFSADWPIILPFSATGPSGRRRRRRRRGWWWAKWAMGKGGGGIPCGIAFPAPSFRFILSIHFHPQESGNPLPSIRRASRWILIQALARDSRMMTMMMSNKNRREKEAEEEEEAEEAEEAEGAPGSCGMFQWHASRSLAAHI